MIDCKNLLLITNSLQKSPSGGRELLCKLNHDALRSVFGDQFFLNELPSNSISGIVAYFNSFRGYIDGLTKDTIGVALQVVHDNNIKKVFVDGSNLGGFVKAVKERFPNVEITTFFHNVEVRFFLGSVRQTKSPKALAVLLANYLAERKAVHYSDKIVCLNKRDSSLLKKLYGRGATHISPMALQDKLPSGHSVVCVPPKEKYALFVGGTFYANRQGIEWFVANVAAKAAIKTYVVGKGFEALKARLERNGNVEVVGSVDSLVPWYLGAHVIIAPIFDGSGMKTKVAEALMFGRRVIGTAEAFVGYEAHIADVGLVCRTVDDFIAAIRDESQLSCMKDSSALRDIYENNYSYEAARHRLSQIIEAPYPPTQGGGV
ncbi:glycosyltransferase family 4 protein [Marinobacter goseongensis]|uniref:glycosyltransferase family 4 protein n=1 Tax=Marinobacter goseongensis TaxID=453838 RepID=UPI002002AB73|nr:glycosyltransferase family 4 protein [Marinobacter goseongensis]MCK7551563.1 glycosyltransferase family 4 protein [Marinobacter goseongensis]